MGSYTYGSNPDAIVAGVIDLMAVRQRLIAERTKRKWTQEDVAERADVRQGQVSRLEDLSQELPDLAARVLFRIIEHGYGLTLSSFFAQFEVLKTKTAADRVPLNPAEQEAHAPAPMADAIDLASVEALIDRRVSALERSLVQRSSKAERKRKDSARARTKPAVRPKDRKDARRRA